MLSLRSEIETAHHRDLVDDAAAARLLAVENGAVFPIGGELRAAAYIGVVLIVTGVGILVRKNIDRIGPVAIVAAIALVAFGCLLPAIRSRTLHRRRSAVGEYVLLLGALLVAADIGFAESRFHFFGPHWANDLLIIAVLHAAGAYWFDSRLLLSASLASFTAWFGFQPTLDTIFDATVATAVRGIAAGAVILVWRIVHERTVGAFDARTAVVRVDRTSVAVGSDSGTDISALSSPEPSSAAAGEDGRRPDEGFQSARENAPFDGFADILEFFAANTALIGSIILTASDSTRPIGFLSAIILSAASIAWGRRQKAFSFVAYGVLYGLLALDIVIATVGEGALIFLFVLVSTPLAALGLFIVHQRMKATR